MRRTELDWNKPLLLRHRTSRLARWSNCASVAWMKLRELQPPVRMMIALALLVLTTLLMGCATPSMPPSEPSRVPAMPQPRQPQPSEPILDRVSRNIEAWEKTLRDSLPTP